MRKIIVSMNVTLDGFMAGTRGELDWHFPLWNSEMLKLACEQLKSVDTILLGRRSYQIMARYWPHAAKQSIHSDEDFDYAYMMNNHQKIVFSTTLKRTEWKNSRLIKANVREELLQLKEQPGKDMIVFGSGALVQTFIRLNLIDEYRIWIHPVVIRQGTLLFKNVTHNLNLKLLETTTFSSGVVLLHYHQINSLVVQ